ncbi:MAG TPA: spore germination protein GerW family protein [Bryobacteraceae bacterium]|nr:spore germination protein GerW family protein [Bryobacteraceae bacterium]
MHETLDTPAAVSQLEEVFKSIVDHSGAKSVYGEPIVLEGKTVLPVARIRYGFGGGSGGKGNQEQYGGGGGGGLLAQPLGVVEITPSETRFVPISPSRAVATAAALGFFLGRLTAPRRR